MTEYTKQEQSILLQIATQAITYGLKHHKEMVLELDSFSEHLREKRASFVTLHLQQRLRGCIGSLEAYQPLILDVSHNAFAAAFLDPRFNPLVPQEFSDLHVHISVLNKAEPIEFTSEQDLIVKLRPKSDGLILTEKGLKATFLPSVWESIPEPSLFLTHLKMKAGLPPGYWSDSIKIQRYTIESIE